MHTSGLYNGWRNNTSNKRAFLLSRSTFAGQQRNAAASWSGDTYTHIDNYLRQIPGGLNLCLTGIPYINNDIGGYHGIRDWSGEQNNELFTRWFQYGAFCPIFRVHGKGHRELFGDHFTRETKAILLKFDKLRYRLMPYIYSLAWKVTSENYTIQRHLIFDYRTDTKVYNIKDQFMFGPAIMVNPVISYGASSRTVYLPSGVWYDFWTGKSLVGGQSINASAPIEKIPLYVKAGSIVPMGPNIQYATQSIDTLEIRVYRGADASFTLYEDEGDNYNYENGDYSTIPFAWNESSHTLTIGSRSGSYIGMPKKRVFNVVWVSSDQDKDIDLTPANRVIRYKGSQVIINCSDPTSLPSSSNNIR